MATVGESTSQVTLSSLAITNIEMHSVFPNALSRKETGVAKSLEACLAAFKAKLPLDDKVGKLVNLDSESTFNDIEDFIKKPGFGFQLIFNINSRDVVKTLKDIQSTRRISFNSNGASMQALLIRGSTTPSKAEIDASQTIGDLQKVSAIYTNSIVNVFLERGVAAMLPQARAKYSDACVLSMSKTLYGNSKPGLAATIKAINFGCLRKPHQCIESTYYNPDVAMAMGLYSLANVQNAKPETVRIGRDMLKKIAMVSTINKANVVALLVSMFENSGSGSAIIDELIEEAEKMVKMLSVPKALLSYSEKISDRTVTTEPPTVKDVAKKATDAAKKSGQGIPTAGLDKIIDKTLEQFLAEASDPKNLP